MSNNSAGDESLAWDRVGQILENTGGLGQRVLQRSLDLWGQVADHLSTNRYTADHLAADAARTLSTMQRNAEDVWTVLTRPPERQRYVAALPTAFLFFDRPQDSRSHTLLDPVIIPVPTNDTRTLPATALIALDGTSSESDQGAGKTSVDGVNALLSRLVARLDTGRRYILETVNAAGEGTPGLVGGVYDGLVYLKGPPLPLANVRVVVEGPPPVV